MKNDTSKSLTALLKRLKDEFAIEDPAPIEPITQLVIGFLQWESTAEKAEEAYAKLMVEMVDINELRISHDDEVAEVIGPKYPMCQERLARLRESLNEIFLREYGVAMHSILDATKKQQRAYLDSLPGMVPYVAGLVMLFGFGGHAIPVDDKLAELLIKEEIVEPDADVQAIEGILQHYIKASDGQEAHLLFQAWSDQNNPPSTTKKKKPASKTSTRKASTKTGTKTTAPKTSSKKTETAVEKS